jgi:hypothetical protein
VQAVPERIQAIYRIRSDAAAIEARAQALAVEQSVEMPLTAIDDGFVRGEIVGRVEAIADEGNGSFSVRVSLSAGTVGDDAGRLVNMLFGNSSLHEDVALLAMQNVLQQRTGATRRAPTCSPRLGVAPGPPNMLCNRSRSIGFCRIGTWAKRLSMLSEP